MDDTDVKQAHTSAADVRPEPDEDDLMGACLDIYRYSDKTGYSPLFLGIEKFEEVAREYCDGLLDFPHRDPSWGLYPNRAGLSFEEIIDFYVGLSVEEKEKLYDISSDLKYNYLKEKPYPEFVRRKIEEEPIIS